MIATVRAGITAPTEEHIRVYRSPARMATNEQATAAIRDAQWLLVADDDEGYPADVVENSRLNLLAVIEAYSRELEYRSQRGLTRAPLTYGIPREYLDELKCSARIEEEIGIAITLRQYGSIYKGLCPFHADRNPSLVVWSASNTWRCFGCNVGGDVLTWVQAWMRTDFHGAVAYLSGRWGVPLHPSVFRNGGGQ